MTELEKLEEMVWSAYRKPEKKQDDRATDFLYDYQLDAVRRMSNGCILCGSVGSGKSRTGLYYYFKECGGWITKKKYTEMSNPKDLIIITTAKKRDSLEWLGELAHFGLYPDKDGMTRFGNKIVVDSWNNIGKYVDIRDSFFLLDEQRLVSYGAWTKYFLKIAKSNNWILLSATPRRLLYRIFTSLLSKWILQKQNRIQSRACYIF